MASPCDRAIVNYHTLHVRLGTIGLHVGRSLVRQIQENIWAYRSAGAGMVGIQPSLLLSACAGFFAFGVFPAVIAGRPAPKKILCQQENQIAVNSYSVG